MRDVHVLPVDAVAARDHRPDRTCWCGPQYLGHDMAEPTVHVYLHRKPDPSPEFVSL